jgi:hypothetical protein
VDLRTSFRVGLVQSEDWETTRKQVIDPINSEIHRHLPTYVRERNLDEILSVYALDTGTGLTWDGASPMYPGREEEMLRWGPATGSETMRERYQHLLDLFPTVDKAELRIHRIHWEALDAEVTRPTCGSS